MKKVKCGYDECSNRRIHWQQPYKMRKHRMVEVPDDFDPKVQKLFCSFECACYSGYMTLNSMHKDQIVEHHGYWWLKDPSGGKDPELKAKFDALKTKLENNKVH